MKKEHIERFNLFSFIFGWVFFVCFFRIALNSINSSIQRKWMCSHHHACCVFFTRVVLFIFLSFLINCMKAAGFCFYVNWTFIYFTLFCCLISKFAFGYTETGEKKLRVNHECDNIKYTRRKNVINKEPSSCIHRIRVNIAYQQHQHRYTQRDANQNTIVKQHIGEVFQLFEYIKNRME